MSNITAPFEKAMRKAVIDVAKEANLSNEWLSYLALSEDSALHLIGGAIQAGALNPAANEDDFTEWLIEKRAPLSTAGLAAARRCWGVAALAALPESAWKELPKLTPSEKAHAQRLTHWAERAFNLKWERLARLARDNGKDIPKDFPNIEALVSWGLAIGISLSDEGRRIADNKNLWPDSANARTGKTESLGEALRRGEQIPALDRLVELATRFPFGPETQQWVRVQTGATKTDAHFLNELEALLARKVGANVLAQFNPAAGEQPFREWLEFAESVARQENRVETNTKPGKGGAGAGAPAKRGPKTKYFLRRHCVKACMKRGLEQSGIEAAVQEFCENHFFEYDGAQMLVIPDELNGITGNVIKHDLAWLRTRGNRLPKLQGDNRAVIRAFEKWLENWTP